MSTAPDAGTLVLAATPIGDPRDAAPRLADELAAADVIAAEDTRRLKRLLADLDVSPVGQVLSYHDHNESTRTQELVERLLAGDRVVVVTDAGMPSVSDPGYRLVAAAVARDVRVTCVPGPSAVLMALAVSGLPVDRFCFEGFLPRKAGERSRLLAELADERRTMVFFEAPHRLAETLAAMGEAFGPTRRAAVCRERPRPTRRSPRNPAGARRVGTGRGQGEITVVVAGAERKVTTIESELSGIRHRVAQGERLKDVCAEVAARTGLSKKALYDAAVPLRGRGEGRRRKGEGGPWEYESQGPFWLIGRCDAPDRLLIVSGPSDFVSKSLRWIAPPCGPSSPSRPALPERSA